VSSSFGSVQKRRGLEFEAETFEADTDSCTGSVGRRHLRGVSIDRLLQLSAAFDARQNDLRFVTQLRFRPTEC
jgi:hypothetical protein